MKVILWKKKKNSISIEITRTIISILMSTDRRNSFFHHSTSTDDRSLWCNNRARISDRLKDVISTSARESDRHKLLCICVRACLSFYQTISIYVVVYGTLPSNSSLSTLTIVITEKKRDYDDWYINGNAYSTFIVRKFNEP